MAKKMLKSFSLRFPSDPGIRPARERLATMNFMDGEMDDVRKNLLWLLDKNEQAKYPASYYYLGASLLEAKNYTQASQAMDLYLASLKLTGKQKTSPPFLADAYYVGAQARQGLGQKKEAIALLESALKILPKDGNDMFLYKLGELNMQDGNKPQARKYFEQLIKDGKDPDWRRLATQSLSSIS
jgi:tetratricopeptide (TPR) repeat protein